MTQMTEIPETPARATLTHALLLSCLLLPLLVTGCQPGETEDPGTADGTPAAEAPAEPGQAAEAGEDITYEPAYPTDVSEEGLSEEDVEQQMGHGHDGNHSHGDDHTHGDDHVHDDDHEHGEHDEHEH